LNKKDKNKLKLYDQNTKNKIIKEKYYYDERIDKNGKRTGHFIIKDLHDMKNSILCITYSKSKAEYICHQLNKGWKNMIW
jgi:hypothetical protein